MGCNSSKNNQGQETLKGKKKEIVFDKNRPEGISKQVDNDWINAVKNENMKEGSLVNPPDDLAKDTRIEVGLNQNILNE